MKSLIFPILGLVFTFNLYAVGQTMPTSQPLSADTPKGALKIYDQALAEGDVDRAVAMVSTTNENEKELVRAMAEFAAGMSHINSASVKAFGADKTHDIFGDPRAAVEANNRNVDQADELIDNNTATVTMKNNGVNLPPIRLVRKDQTWLVTLRDFTGAPLTPEACAARAHDLRIEAKVFTDCLTDLQNGKYQDIEKLKESIRSRLMAAITATTLPTSQPAGK